MVVGMPNESITSMPLPLNSLLYSPEIPPRPAVSVSHPILLDMMGSPRSSTVTMKPILMKSVVMEPRMPLKKVYMRGIAASNTVVTRNDIPVILWNIVAPASSWTAKLHTCSPKLSTRNIVCDRLLYFSRM